PLRRDHGVPELPVLLARDRDDRRNGDGRLPAPVVVHPPVRRRQHPLDRRGRPGSAAVERRIMSRMPSAGVLREPDGAPRRPSQHWPAAPVALAAITRAMVAPTAQRGQPDYDVKAHYQKRELFIPMRDGVKLFTIVYAPRDTTARYPLLLTRTAYGIAPYGP